ncbi:MAG: winged helix-turn-helix domain-containing protein [Lachnospiraceae bacterium]|nr:winged helix-turn-helix domain-containing protein [Lachnospiraceae bacterium]
MLWTRAAVCKMIQETYRITIPRRSISEYLKRWGMTCQRPTKKAYKQDSKKPFKHRKNKHDFSNQ